MSTLVLNLDDRLADNLAELAARSGKPVPEWAAEQLTRIVDLAEKRPTSYSAEWLAAFGSIDDESFEAPTRSAPRPVASLEAE